MFDITKQVIGLVGETLASLELHRRGWLVYRPVVDEQIDLIISRYYCKNCSKFSGLYIRETLRGGEKQKAVTNLCENCQRNDLIFIVRYLQVKTSEGVAQKAKKPRYPGAKEYSFHAKLRHNVDPRSFYIWVAILDNKEPSFYVFGHNEINKFDDISLPSYQNSDNQKTKLRIDTTTGQVLNQAKIQGRSYSYFNNPNEFFDNFDKLETIIPGVDF